MKKLLLIFILIPQTIIYAETCENIPKTVGPIFNVNENKSTICPWVTVCSPEYPYAASHSAIGYGTSAGNCHKTIKLPVITKTGIHYKTHEVPVPCPGERKCASCSVASHIAVNPAYTKCVTQQATAEKKAVEQKAATIATAAKKKAEEATAKAKKLAKQKAAAAKKAAQEKAKEAAAAAKKAAEQKISAAKAFIAKSGVAQAAEQKSAAIAKTINTAVAQQISTATNAAATARKNIAIATNNTKAALAQATNKITKPLQKAVTSSQAAAKSAQLTARTQVKQAVEKTKDIVATMKAEIKSLEHHMQKLPLHIICTSLKWPDQDNLATLSAVSSKTYPSAELVKYTKGKPVAKNKIGAEIQKFCTSKIPSGYSVAYPATLQELQPAFRKGFNKGQAALNAGVKSLNQSQDQLNDAYRQLKIAQAKLTNAFTKLHTESTRITQQEKTVTAGRNSSGVKSVISFLKQVLTDSTDLALIAKLGTTPLTTTEMTTLTTNTQKELNAYVSAGYVTTATSQAIMGAIPQINQLGAAHIQLMSAQKQINHAYVELMPSQNTVGKTIVQLAVAQNEINSAAKSIKQTQVTLNRQRSALQSVLQITGLTTGTTITPAKMPTNIFVPISDIKIVYPTAPSGPYLDYKCESIVAALPPLFGYADADKFVVMSTCKANPGDISKMSGLSECKKINYNGKSLYCSVRKFKIMPM